jgi:hypothetical protein
VLFAGGFENLGRNKKRHRGAEDPPQQSEEKRIASTDRSNFGSVIVRLAMARTIHAAMSVPPQTISSRALWVWSSANF